MESSGDGFHADHALIFGGILEVLQIFTAGIFGLNLEIAGD